MEYRRIHRIGHSNLVTIPMKYCQSLGIKPGCTVNIKKHGNEIRIIPIGENTDGGGVENEKKNNSPE